MTKQQQLLVALYERHQSLLQDGYTDISNTNLQDSCFIRMRHRNGNYISLCANYRDFSIIQRTNGLIVHKHAVC